MAENLDDGEFWLPPQFLTNDDTPLNNINDFNYGNLTSLLNGQNDVVLRQMFSYGSSYPYSPVESSETESSDEEEQHLHQIADLTRRVAHTTLGHDLHHHSLTTQKPKSVVVSGSPQSTLCGCGGRGGSSSSPNSGCHVTSQRATWDLLRAAAGEVERMRLGHHHLNDNFTIERRRLDHNNNTSVVAPPTNPGIVAFNNNNHHHLSVTQQKLQIAQFEMLRQQQMAKQHPGSVPVWCGAQNRGGRSEVGSVGVRKVGGLCDAAAWPSMQAQQHVKQQNQQQYGSGMRAVFLGNPKRESAGTGVFLPRRVDRAAESKKKSGCSTVLVPARVVQALNLKLEDMVPVHNHHHSRSNLTSNMENAAGSTIPRIRSNYGFSQQKRNNLRPQPQVSHEIRLPQEWTY